jgi:hypothetical protein
MSRLELILSPSPELEAVSMPCMARMPCAKMHVKQGRCGQFGDGIGPARLDGPAFREPSLDIQGLDI